MMTIRSKPITDSYLKGIDQNLSLGDESALLKKGSGGDFLGFTLGDVHGSLSKGAGGIQIDSSNTRLDNP